MGTNKGIACFKPNSGGLFNADKSLVQTLKKK
jgi:hypothetical protein